MSRAEAEANLAEAQAREAERRAAAPDRMAVLEGLLREVVEFDDLDAAGIPRTMRRRIDAALAQPTTTEPELPRVGRKP